MTVEQFQTVMGYYENLLRQVLTPTTTPEGLTHGPVPAPKASAQPAPATAGEGLPAVPSPASSSAPEPDPPDAAERDRQRLRAEVSQWDLRVPPEEVEHVIQHHPYSKARALLWTCRRQDVAA